MKTYRFAIAPSYADGFYKSLMAFLTSLPDQTTYFLRGGLLCIYDDQLAVQVKLMSGSNLLALK